MKLTRAMMAGLMEMDNKRRRLGRGPRMDQLSKKACLALRDKYGLVYENCGEEIESTDFGEGVIRTLRFFGHTAASLRGE